MVNTKGFPGLDVITGQSPATCPPATHGNCKVAGKSPMLHHVYRLSKLDQFTELIEAGVALIELHRAFTVE